MGIWKGQKISIFCSFIHGDIFRCSTESSVQSSLQFLKDKYYLSRKELNNFLPQFFRLNLIFKKLSLSNMHIEKQCTMRTDCTPEFAINRYT